jgi:hypothetical protein
MIGIHLQGSIPPEDFWEDLFREEARRGCDICKGEHQHARVKRI